jgi:hypothetical protein
MVLKFSACLEKEKIKEKLSACFFYKTLTNPKDCLKSRIRISVPAFYVDFLQCTRQTRLSEQFSELQVAFGTTF